MLSSAHAVGHMADIASCLHQWLCTTEGVQYNPLAFAGQLVIQAIKFTQRRQPVFLTKR